MDIGLLKLNGLEAAKSQAANDLFPVVTAVLRGEQFESAGVGGFRVADDPIGRGDENRKPPRSLRDSPAQPSYGWSAKASTAQSC